MNGDCLEHLKELPDNSVDAIITDPPYGIGFMGKEWDDPDKERELIERERIRSEQRKKEGKSPTTAPFSQSVRPGLAIRDAETNRWYQKWTEEWSKETLRVLKPGGYLLSFCATRMYHRMTCGIEDAGFEIRDCIMWIYASGFPKSLNIGKQIDKMNFRFYDKGFQDYCNECRKAKGYSHNKVNELIGSATTDGGFSSSIMGDKQFNELPTLEMYNKLKPILEMDDRYDELIKKTEAEREVIGKKKWDTPVNGFLPDGRDKSERKLLDETAPATQEAKEWEGWGTALKPACEPIVVARKPLSEKNVALNVLKWGTGGINIDESRIESMKDLKDLQRKNRLPTQISEGNYYADSTQEKMIQDREGFKDLQGRFPANIILDEESAKMLDEQSGVTISKARIKPSDTISEPTIDFGGGFKSSLNEHNDKGGASRFFYVAKASKSERNFGLDEKQEVRYEDKTIDDGREVVSDRPHQGGATQRKNNHPTVKPIKLMEYLIKLVSKEGSVILDPFLGSGTTAIACLKLNRNFIGIEKEPEYVKIAQARIKPYSEKLNRPKKVHNR